MKLITVTIFLFISLCTLAYSNNDYYVIQTSVETSAFVKGQFLRNYPIIKIPKEKEVILDITEFKSNFEKYYNVYNGLKPNVISIISGKNKYRLPLVKGINKYILNANSLLPVKGYIPFTKFDDAGKLWFIIGADRYENINYIVNPMWLGIAEIIK